MKGKHEGTHVACYSRSSGTSFSSLIAASQRCMVL